MEIAQRAGRIYSISETNMHVRTRADFVEVDVAYRADAAGLLVRKIGLFVACHLEL